LEEAGKNSKDARSDGITLEGKRELKKGKGKKKEKNPGKS